MELGPRAVWATPPLSQLRLGVESDSPILSSLQPLPPTEVCPVVEDARPPPVSSHQPSRWLPTRVFSHAASVFTACLGGHFRTPTLQMWKLRHQEAGAALWLDQGRAKVASEHRPPWAFARRAQWIQGDTPPESHPLSFMQPVLDDPVVIARPAETEALLGSCMS